MDRTVIERLTAIAGRGACTDAERRAAAALHDELRAQGKDVYVEARWVRPQRRASVAFHAALAAAASLVSVVAAVPAAAVAAFAALSLAMVAAGRTAPLAYLLPRRATQHVLVEPAGEGVALLIVAGYDAPRADLAAARWLREAAWLSRVRGGGVAWLAVAAALVAGSGLARALGVGGTWLGVAQLVPTVALFAGAAAAIDAATRPWSQGAGRAAGAAVALRLLEELRREPPRALAPGLLLVGAREAGPQALRAHLRVDGARPEDTVVLELGPFGAAAPAWAARHEQLRAAGERATAALTETSRARHDPRRQPRLRRLPAIAIAAPSRAADDPGELDDAALEAALDLALAVVDALDADLAARVEPVPGAFTDA